MFRLEGYFIQEHLGMTSLKELVVLKILLTSLRVSRRSWEESSSMVTVVVHSRGIIATGSVVCAIGWIEFLRTSVRMLVLVVFISRMHLEFMVTLVEIVTFVDNMVIERPIALSVYLSFDFWV